MISRDTSSGGRSTFFSPPLLSFSFSRILCDVSYQFLSLSPLPPRAKICRFDRFFIFFWKDATGDGFVSDGSEEDGREVVRMVEGGRWNCENRHAHARDRTHVRTTRHAAEHYGFRRPISTSRTDETRRKQPIARPRPDRKENPSRLIPRFRKR